MGDEIAEASNMIGHCFYKQGEYSDALKHFMVAASTRNRASKQEPTDHTLAVYYESVGACFFQMKKFIQPVAYYEKSKTIYENIGEASMGEKIAEASNMTGHCFYKQGEYCDGLKHCMEAASARKHVSKQESTDHVLAVYYVSVGDCLLQMKKLNEAVAYCEKSEKIMRTTQEQQARGGDIASIKLDPSIPIYVKGLHGTPDGRLQPPKS